MKLQVVKTTDNNFVGRVFEVPFLDLTGVHMPVSFDVVFWIGRSEDLGGGTHSYSNPNYVAIAREVT